MRWSVRLSNVIQAGVVAGAFLSTAPSRASHATAPLFGVRSSRQSSPPASRTPGPGLAADPRLTRTIAFEARGETLADCLIRLSASAGVNIGVDPAISHRRVTIFASHSGIWRIMAGIASVIDGAWQKGEPGDDVVYQLYQTDEQKERERRAVAVSRRREEQERNARRAALLAAIDKAIADRKDDDGAIAGLLASLAPEERGRLADTANEPIGVIAANNQSHYASHLVNATPWNRFSTEQQRAIAGTAAGPALGSGGASFASAASDPGALNGRYVGIVAADGAVRLAVVNADGQDVWVAPFDAVQRRPLPGIDTDNDFSAEINEALARGSLVDLSEMPHEQRYKKRLRFPSEVERARLSSLLSSIAAQTGFSIVSDDFMASSRTPYPWLFTDKDEYTLDEALGQIARSLAHHIEYREGALRVRTLCPGRDLRAEPPFGLMDRLRAAFKDHKPAQLADYLEVACLSDLQLTTLVKSHDPQELQQIRIDKIFRLRRALRFYSGLSDEQRKRAESDVGLLPNDMEIDQQKAFRDLAVIGLPVRSGIPNLPKRPGLRITCTESGTGAQHLTLVFVSRTDPLVGAVYDVGIP